MRRVHIDGFVSVSGSKRIRCCGDEGEHQQSELSIGGGNFSSTASERKLASEQHGSEQYQLYDTRCERQLQRDRDENVTGTSECGRFARDTPGDGNLPGNRELKGDG